MSISVGDKCPEITQKHGMTTALNTARMPDQKAIGACASKRTRHAASQRPHAHDRDCASQGSSHLWAVCGGVDDSRVIEDNTEDEDSLCVVQQIDTHASRGDWRQQWLGKGRPHSASRPRRKRRRSRASRDGRKHSPREREERRRYCDTTAAPAAARVSQHKERRRRAFTAPLVCVDPTALTLVRSLLHRGRCTR